MATDDDVAEARRKIHESLVGSPAWVADTVREELAQLEAAIEAHVREQSIPAWEAVYEPGNVSDYLIGYANDEDPAKAAAASWFTAQYMGELGRLVWAAQVHGDDFTAWFDLIHVDPELGETSTGITVRCRAQGAGQ